MKAKKPDNVNDTVNGNDNVNDTVTVNDTVIKKEGARERKKTVVEYTNDFNVFWSTYPKKVGKGEAFKAFQKVNPDTELLNTMLNAINAVRQSEQWQRDGGRYIPNPLTWLNQRRWEDEPLNIPEKSNAKLEAEKRNKVIDNALTEDMERDDFDIYEYYARKL
ncbi:MAG: hypothetical protein LUD81_01395 [Clostridiales bacterium]|nr:hypothetical protein [Clostridiales bacterium]